MTTEPALEGSLVDRLLVAESNLGSQLLIDLESELEPVSLYGGETLLRHGEPCDSM